MIVITTPTGQIGRHVVQHCIQSDERVRLVARKPKDLTTDVRRRVDVTEGSHGDAAVIDAALEGANALFWLIPPEPRSDSMQRDYLDFTRPAADAVRRHGVSHVVTVQAISGGTRWAETAGPATVSQHMADILAKTGAALRSLAAPSLMDNMLMQLDPIRRQGVFYGAYDAGARMPQVASRDIGAAAARLLLDRSWSGQATLPVLGPEDRSMNDMAEIMTAVLGRPVRYQQVPYDGFLSQMRERGMPNSYAEGMVEMMRAKNEGLDNAPARDAAPSTPTTFQQWCKDVLLPATRAQQVKTGKTRCPNEQP